MLNDINPLKPSYIYKIWGGEKLSKKKLESTNTSANNNPLGETWEVSIHPEGPSFLMNGEYLSNYYSENELPYLIKFIDTNDFLSVQVHPNDEYAKKVENSIGKTECWIITDADPGAGIYLGFENGVDAITFKKAVDNKEDLTPYLKFHEVKKGDLFVVPAGSIHAIGKGITLIEIQQSSGITYRVWDWNRVEKDGRPRALHIEKAMDILDFASDHNTDEYFKIRKNLNFCEGSNEVLSHRDFDVSLVNLNQGFNKHQLTGKRAVSVVCLEGNINISSKNQEQKLNAFESAIIKLDVNELEISTEGRCSYVFVT